MEESQQGGRYKLDTKRPSTLFLLMLLSLPLSLIVSIAPALHGIVADFCVTQQSVHSLINYGLIGYTIGPLFAGPVGKFFGRRVTIFSGLAIAVFGVCLKLVTYYPRAFPLFVIGHFISVLGGSFCLVVVYAIIHDYYYFKEAKRVLSFVVGGYLFVPGIMTTLCSVIEQRYHWIDIQYFLLAFLVMLGLMTIKHPETRQIGCSQHVRIRKIFSDYGKTIRNPLFLCFSILVGIAIGTLYLFIAEVPIIALQHLKISPQLFWYLNLIPYVGGSVSLFVTGKLSYRISAHKISIFALICALFLSVVFLISFLFSWITTFSLFFFSFLIISLAMPVSVSGISLLHRYVHDRSNTSALLVTFFTTMITLMVYISGSIRPDMGLMTYPCMLLASSILLTADYIVIRILVKKH